MAMELEDERKEKERLAKELEDLKLKIHVIDRNFFFNLNFQFL